MSGERSASTRRSRASTSCPICGTGPRPSGSTGRSHAGVAIGGGSGAIAAGAPVTLQLSLMGMILSIIVSVPLGTLAAARRDSSIDAVASLLALVGVCVPFFWMGLLLILLFSVGLHWLPAGGFVPFAE